MPHVSQFNKTSVKFNLFFLSPSSFPNSSRHAKGSLGRFNQRVLVLALRAKHRAVRRRQCTRHAPRSVLTLLRARSECLCPLAAVTLVLSQWQRWLGLSWLLRRVAGSMCMACESSTRLHHKRVRCQQLDAGVCQTMTGSNSRSVTRKAPSLTGTVTLPSFRQKDAAHCKPQRGLAAWPRAVLVFDAAWSSRLQHCVCDSAGVPGPY